MDEKTALIANRTTRIRNRRLYLAVFSAVLGNFNFGFSLVYPSPVIPQLQNSDDPRLRLNMEQVAQFGSIFTLGAAAGGLGAMLLNDLIGRKISIMASAVPSTVGYLLMGSAQAIWMLQLGRFLTGIAGGMTAASIPVYISEISHPAVRGALGSCPQITAVIGALALYALGLVLPWRWLAVVGEVPALLMVFLLCCMPSSPRYLLTKGHQERARRALEWLRGPDSDYRRELRSIEIGIATQGRIRWAELTTPYYYKPILISVVMRFLQQMSGITPILVYLEPIFLRTKVSLEPRYDAVLVGGVRLVSIVIAASLMDKAGRKILLYTSGFLMFVSTLAMTMYSHTTPCPGANMTMPAVYMSQDPPAFNSVTLIPLISIMLFICGYAIGWGPITWLLMSEILPLGARGVASGLCVGVSWITAYGLTHGFIDVVDSYGLFVPFLFFSVVCVINILFTAIFVPETRKRSLEEIENFFRTGRSFTITTADHTHSPAQLTPHTSVP